MWLCVHLARKATSATVVLHLVYLGIGSIPRVVVIVEKGIVDYNECYCAAPAVAWLGRAQIWIHVFSYMVLDSMASSMASSMVSSM